MVNDMIVPEEVYFMTPAMDPVTLEIYYEKSDDVCKNCGFDMENGDIIYKPAIRNDSDANSKYIFYDVGNSTAETWHTVKSANDVKPFFPFYNFLNQKEKNKKGDSDV